MVQFNKMKYVLKIPKDFINSGTLSYTETRKLADLIEKSIIFQREIEKIRKKYKLNENFSDQETLDNDDILYVSNIIYQLDDSEFSSDLHDLLDRLALPFHLDFSLMFVAITGVFFFPPQRMDVSIISPKKYEFKTLDEYLTMETSSLSSELDDFKNNRALFISIKKNMGVTEFIRLIREKWHLIEKDLKDFPKIKTHRFLRSELDKKIVSMRDKEKKTYGQIADELADKFEKEGNYEMHDKMTEDYVKNRYHSWKKMV